MQKPRHYQRVLLIGAHRSLSPYAFVAIPVPWDLNDLKQAVFRVIDSEKSFVRSFQNDPPEIIAMYREELDRKPGFRFWLASKKEDIVPLKSLFLSQLGRYSRYRIKKDEKTMARFNQLEPWAVFTVTEPLDSEVWMNVHDFLNDLLINLN